MPDKSNMDNIENEELNRNESGEQGNSNQGEKPEFIVKHKISAEETFTLAKDVYDMRTFIKKIYANRAVISRRLNIFSLICSIIFTLIYTGYTVYAVLSDELVSMELGIATYCIIGTYFFFAILLVFATLFAGRANTKTIKKYNRALKIFRFCVRIASIAMAVFAITISTMSSQNSLNLAFQTMLVIFSVIIIIIQLIPLLFGGIANLARWAVSPAKGKTRFSVVLMDWYGILRQGNGQYRSTSKISPKYIDVINKCLDSYFIPILGKKKVRNINASDIYTVTETVPEDMKELAEGIFKSVFEYAEECGYIINNPTKAMDLSNGLEEKKKKTKLTFKDRIRNLGKKIGTNIVKSYLDGDDDKQ